MLRTTRSPSTLREIRDTYDVTVYCSRCGHSAPLPFDVLAARYGWDEPLPTALCALIRCSKCGLKVGPSGKTRDGDLIQTIMSPLCTKGMIVRGIPSEVPTGAPEAPRVAVRRARRKSPF